MGRTGHDVVLARHGQTEWSLSGQHTGVSDIPLTAAGREQARALAGRLAGRDFALVLSSPLERALETCRLAGLGDRMAVREALREWDYGEYEGLTTKEIQAGRPGWHLFDDGCPGGERAQDVGDRMDPVVAELREAGGDAAVFGHGHCLRVLAARWLGLGARDGARFALSTATLSVLGGEHDRPALWAWNQAAA
ncbi:MAG TPA: histidine phosphatase family protein [Solirubrobacteraceae bacterium]|nr:histidine phosphatase family protein [Solirubrobacteraceae bacterium]